MEEALSVCVLKKGEGGGRLVEERRGIPERQGRRDGWGLLLYGRTCRRTGARPITEERFLMHIKELLTPNGRWGVEGGVLKVACARGGGGNTLHMEAEHENRPGRARLDRSRHVGSAAGFRVEYPTKKGFVKSPVSCRWSGADPAGARTRAVIPVRLCGFSRRERLNPPSGSAPACVTRTPDADG